MDVFFQIDEPFAAAVSPVPVEQAVRATVQFLAHDENRFSGITVVITGSGQVQELNRQYRGVDAPTDVLSFENSPESDFPQPDSETNRHLGDIVIAYSLAYEQAMARGHAVLAEIVLLVVHGTLHLLGFNHDTPENKERMWAAQSQIMAQLDLSHIEPTET
jgi:probable rRNA maturation factor